MLQDVWNVWDILEQGHPDKKISRPWRQEPKVPTFSVCQTRGFHYADIGRHPVLATPDNHKVSVILSSIDSLGKAIAPDRGWLWKMTSTGRTLHSRACVRQRWLVLMTQEAGNEVRLVSTDAGSSLRSTHTRWKSS
jgi:hypothetical protein